jgi:hypothetical protein
MGKKEKTRMQYAETVLEHWNDFSMLSNRFISAFAFRGQANSEWKITSSIERMIDHLYPPNPIQIYSTCPFERNLLREFKWKYPLYEKNYIPDDNRVIEWLSIMQHYGCPTRMVDFTFSPYVALFMALNESDYNYSSIWCINQNICMAPFSKEHKQSDDKTEYLDKNMFNDYIYEKANKMLRNALYNNPSSEPSKRIYLVRPQMINERINRQQGLFAIPESTEVSFEDNVFPLLSNKEVTSIPFKKLIDYSYSPEGKYGAIDYALIKINIPSDFKYDIKKSLYHMNITDETMFPGLEGLSKSLIYNRLFK